MILYKVSSTILNTNVSNSKAYFCHLKNSTINLKTHSIGLCQCCNRFKDVFYSFKILFVKAFKNNFFFLGGFPTTNTGTKTPGRDREKDHFCKIVILKLKALD
jgi:hypothetical protein